MAPPVNPSARRTRLRIERLESREVPAAIVDSRTLAYRDADGDMVRVVFSKPLLNSGNADQIFHFDVGGVNGGTGTPQQLQEINFDSLGAAAAGVGVSVRTTGAPQGDGQVHVGFIHSTHPLGDVYVGGDLGRVVANPDGTTALGLRSLDVGSMGKFGIATQAAGGKLNSIVIGRVGSLRSRGPVTGVFIDVQNGIAGVVGSIGSITINGSLIGTDAAHGGQIRAMGDIGAIQIVGDLQGGLGTDSGTIYANGKIASLLVTGSVRGGIGTFSGRFTANTPSGPLRINGDVVGGAGALSAFLGLGGAASINIGGSIIGGTSLASGGIQCFGDVGSFRVGGNIVGGSASTAGNVQVFSINTLTIGGSMIGGAGQSGGVLFASGDVGTATVHGSILGGGGGTGGVDVQGDIGSITVFGDLIGGDNPTANFMNGNGFIRGRDIDSVLIKGKLVSGMSTGGGPLHQSGAIVAENAIGSVTIQGAVQGNANTAVTISARGQASPPSNSDMAIGKLTFRRNVTYLNVLAGYSHFPWEGGVNGDAQIGNVEVHGTWTASNLVAGVGAGIDGQFGTSDDVNLDNTNPSIVLSQIRSVNFLGGAAGTAAGGDHFGIVAVKIKSLRVGGWAYPLQRGPLNDGPIPIGTFGDFALLEVGDRGGPGGGSAGGGWGGF